MPADERRKNGNGITILYSGAINKTGNSKSVRTFVLGEFAPTAHTHAFSSRWYLFASHEKLPFRSELYER